MAKARAVRIRGGGYTSAKQAIKYVRRGQARVIGDNEIEFIETDHRVLSATRSMEATTKTEPVRATPSHGPALVVVPTYGDQSPRTFAPYPMLWEGYGKAA
jgi:hypothetical protein